MKVVQPSHRAVTPLPDTVVLLVRHATTDAVGLRLTSRTPGVPLNARGRAEADRLAQQLADVPVSAVYSSPLERARQTADPIARRHALDVHLFEPLNEVDFGAWTGATFDTLATCTEWRDYNEQRGRAVIPGGESPSDTQARVARALTHLHQRHPGETIVAVSHAEIVRYAVLLARDASLDDWHTVSIEPAGVIALCCGAIHLREVHAATVTKPVYEQYR